MADCEKLVSVLRRLSAGGNTVLIIEHNLDVIKACDYVIDLGPEGGDAGGTLIAAGTPEEIASCEERDALREEYGLARLSRADFEALDPAAVIGSRRSPYGVSAILRRSAAPAGLALEPVSIEDLFILMVKEGEQ